MKEIFDGKLGISLGEPGPAVYDFEEPEAVLQDFKYLLVREFSQCDAPRSLMNCASSS